MTYLQYEKSNTNNILHIIYVHYWLWENAVFEAAGNVSSATVQGFAEQMLADIRVDLCFKGLPCLSPFKTQ